MREIIYRHSWIVRIAHWINALCFLLLLMSGRRGPHRTMLLMLLLRRLLRLRTPPVLSPRRQLRKSRGCAKQNACCQRRAADDVPHSPVHIFCASSIHLQHALSRTYPCAYARSIPREPW